MVSVAGTQHKQVSDAAAKPAKPEGTDAPGKSGLSVGHLAKAQVAAAREAGEELAPNALGKAAASIAKMTFEQRAALLEPDPVQEPDPVEDTEPGEDTATDTDVPEDIGTSAPSPGTDGAGGAGADASAEAGTAAPEAESDITTTLSAGDVAVDTSASIIKLLEEAADAAETA